METVRVNRRAFLRRLLALLAGGVYALGSGPVATLAAPRPASRAASPEQQVDLLAYVTAYKRTLPGRDSRAFRDPTEAEQAAFVAALDLILAGDPASAAEALDGLGYDLLWLVDLGTSGARHLALREREPYQRCWGLFLLAERPSPTPSGPTLVESCHPVADVNSAELAIQAYRALGASAFLVAGCHRFANGHFSTISDMARNDHSVFQRAHERLATPAHHVLNYHGFSGQDRPSYPNVVLSNGSSTPHAELFALEEQLEVRGESVGIYDGNRFAPLAGGINPQGRHTRAIGGRFYHLEHVTGIRADSARRARCVEAVVATLHATI